MGARERGGASFGQDTCSGCHPCVTSLLTRFPGRWAAGLVSGVRQLEETLHRHMLPGNARQLLANLMAPPFQ